MTNFSANFAVAFVTKRDRRSLMKMKELLVVGAGAARAVLLLMMMMMVQLRRLDRRLFV